MKIFLLTYFKRRNALKKIQKPHSGRYVSIDKARRIGFIFDAALPESDEALNLLFKELHDRNKNFCGIIVDSRKKKLSRQQPVPHYNEFIYLSKKDLNWYGKPQCATSDGFMSQHYDIFIDLSAAKRNFTLDYVIRNTDCDLRIGTNNCPSRTYDLMITANPPADSGKTEISGLTLVRNILNYLTTIQ